MADIILCAICDNPVTDDEESQKLGKKGCESISRASMLRGMTLDVEPGQYVHSACRRDHIDGKRISSAHKRVLDVENPMAMDRRRSLRAEQENDFDLSCACFYCGFPYTFESKKCTGHKLIPCRELGTYERIRERCKIRNDSWSDKVSLRIANVIDLPAADAVYHEVCRSNFSTGKDLPLCFIPSEISSKRKKTGRHKNSTQEEAFVRVMDDFLHNEDENEGTTTINNLISEMDWYLSQTSHTAYSFPYMKDQIQNYVGSRCVIGEVDGRENTVTLIDSASKILLEYYRTNQQERDTEKEKIHLIQTACKLIKNDIRTIDQAREYYPDLNDLKIEKALEYLPESLKLFITNLTTRNTNPIKVASLGHALVQASRPRSVLAPLQLGLAIQMHTQFASRFLIDSLSHQGFCLSYSEVQNFERNAAVNSGTNLPIETLTKNQSINYTGDNADSSSMTLNGRFQFHGMGIIATVTPGTKPKSKKIPRIKVTNEDIGKVGSIEIILCPKLKDGLRSVRYKELSAIKYPDPTEHLEWLWKAGNRAGWSGMMQMIQKGQYPGKSSVIFLPMIDLNASDVNCIYTTLCYVSNHAKRYNVTPVLTFDQPLWWKALNIIENECLNSDLRKIVLKLGVMHLKMSYLGSIGHNMANSGLQNLLELPYAENSVPKLLTGKSLERATRGHQLVNTALQTLLEEKAVADKLLHETDIHAIRLTHEQMLRGEIQPDDENANNLIKKYQQQIEKVQGNLASSRTGKLWLQYMKQCDIERKLQKAERTGNWSLHLQAVRDTLKTLVATGHSLYTMTGSVYLQRMQTLEKDFPEVYRLFTQGHHVVRLSDKFWCGLPTDQAIEQTLMKYMKSSGGLSRGRGWTEIQRQIWLMSRPVCADVNRSMQELTNVAFETSEQHKENTRARLKKDAEDVSEMVTYLKERNPFDGDPNLRNIATGLVCNKSNADSTFETGEAILKNMNDKSVVEYTFRKKDQIRNMSTNTIKIAGQHTSIDPQILFQRFIPAGLKEDKLPEMFKHELCAYPAALFEDKYIMLEADKPALADALWSLLPEELHPTSINSENVHYVIDGGWLLHRVDWVQKESIVQRESNDKAKTKLNYGNIAGRYVAFVRKNYGHSTTVVFDGYPDTPQTKDATHSRRSGAGPRCADTLVTPLLEVHAKREDFLSNPGNKQQLILLVAERLKTAGYHVLQAEADADLPIVQAAIAKSAVSDVVLIGSDTDLLVLLLYHVTSQISNDIYYTPVTQQCTKKSPRIWNIKAVQNSLGPDVCKNILFIHALAGCDTTSRPFGVGKAIPLKLIRSNEHFRKLAETFANENAPKETIINSGEFLLMILYAMKKGELSLDDIRLRKFLRRLHEASTFIHPKNLAPTSSAGKYHSLRMYYQIQNWKNIDMCPLEWGWLLKDNKYVPAMSDMPIAPDYLLKKIRCGCKADCATMRCSCKKLGLDCSLVCECAGDCLNHSVEVEDDDDADE